MNAIIKVFLISMIIFLTACSEDKETSGEHVWKEQTDTINKAKQVEAMIMDSAEKQKKAIEEQIQ
ncbi:MAG: hypothetical protein O6928_07420 [Gammaproteobacteria bacterium]|nr:hypothetical protein [Gammaproteobacteria bacterium]